MTESQQATVFIGNLPKSPTPVNEAEQFLYEVCSQCGTVNSLRCPSDGGYSKGFAFVEFDNPAACLYASLALSNIICYGRNLRCSYAGSDEAAVVTKLDGIPFECDEIELYERLSRIMPDIRAISCGRRQDGSTEGRVTIWLKSPNAKQELISMWPRFIKEF